MFIQHMIQTMLYYVTGYVVYFTFFQYMFYNLFI